MMWIADCGLRIEIIIADETAMLEFGKKLAEYVDAPCIIYLIGELGAGKTTLVRGFLQGLHYQGIVKSPTYTLVESYFFGEKQIFHFDLYRLADPRELDYIGIEDYFSATSICLIEWPERGQPILAGADLCCTIAVENSGRLVVLQASSSQGEEILKKMK